ncbi:putative transposase-like protein [Orchesella cincta]|uniref:Putative transposase-like protein n=1 Tax=Orchesella cincta TaxID=48709 RepID=A0A1D2M220_ORCCI|nr:putative transposase-like protein [Orchesella cincta]
MSAVLPKLSLTARDVFNLLEKSPFGFVQFGRVIQSDIDALSLAIHSGLIDINNAPRCVCGNIMRLRQRLDKSENAYQGFGWQCHGSSRCHSSHCGSGQLGVSKDAAIDWYSFCRQICYDTVSDLDICIGGPGLHVELDESHIFKRKYNRGRQLAFQHVWIFGAICRESKEAFVQVVADRTGATLWPIIRRKVYPGTVILTDSARVYNSLHEAERGGFEHYQVNHRRNFVHPDNPNVHTNTIEPSVGFAKENKTFETLQEEARLTV